MSKVYTLHAVARSIVGKKNAALRKHGQVPGVIYGRDVENRLVSVAEVPLGKVFMSAGESSLVDLVVDGSQPLKVLIHDIQRNPLTDAIRHVDFYQVNMAEKVTTEVPLVFHGEAKAVKELGGVLVKAIDHLKVSCLPQDLVHEIVVDLSVLEQFNDAIHVHDVIVPSGLTVLSHVDDMVASVQEPRAEEEVKAEEVAPVADLSAVEVEKKGKKEEDGEETKTGAEVKAKEKKEK